MVLEYMPQNLHQKIGGQPLSVPDVRCFSFQLLRALAHLDGLHIVHRDLKPENILLEPSVRAVKLADFGSAKVLTDEPSCSYICSRWWRAPELIFGATRYSTSIDWWSCGCIIAEMMLGKPLFTGESSWGQMYEIIRALGTPSLDQLRAMQVGDSAMSVERLTGVTGGDMALAGALSKAGWNVTKLGALQGAEEAVLRSVVLGLEMIDPELEVSEERMRPLVQLAGALSECIHLVEGGAEDDPIMADKLVAAQERLSEARQAEQARQWAALARSGDAPRMGWSSRLERELHKAESGARAVEGAEAKDRSRWLRRLTRLIVVGADTPDEVTGRTMASRAMAGFRTLAIRKHVKVWERYMDWLVATTGLSWPTKAYHLQEYMRVLAEEPNDHAVPRSFWRTLRFMEEAAQEPEDQRWSNSSAVRNTLESVSVSLRRLDPRDREQARILPVVIVQAMEEVVLNEELGRFVRAYAWYRLFKLWGALSHQDAEGIRLASVSLDVSGLACRISRETGIDNAEDRDESVFVGADTFIDQPEWLETGWNLWKRMARDNRSTDRKYFLQLPENDLQGSQNRRATYTAAATLSQALFKVLKVPGEDGLLLDMGLGSAWSEHSEKATLRRWASAAGVPIEVAKLMGKKRAEDGRPTSQADRRRIVEAQAHICKFIKLNVGRADPFDEASVVEDVVEKMACRGATEFEQKDQEARLTSFGNKDRPTKMPKTSDGLERTATAIPLKAFVVGVASSEEEEVQWRSLEDDKGTGTGTSPKRVIGCYVTGEGATSRVKTLHRMGGCHRQPGIHYRGCEFHGLAPPGGDKYHRACAACFPGKKGKHGLVTDDEGSSGVSWISSSADSD
eukprot:s1069_g18.t1